MTPHELWLHINPRHPSDSDRGWDFRPYQERGSAVWPVLAVVGCALIICGMAAIFITGGQNV